LVPGDDFGGKDIPGIIATADPPDHERQRRVLSKKFSVGTIRAMEPSFRDLVASALTEVGIRGRFDWMSLVAEPLPMVMVARILGFSDDELPILRRFGFGLVDRISGFATEQRIQELETEGISDISLVVDAYMKARAGSVEYGDGVITAVAKAANTGELDDVEALGILTVLLAAGGESTTSLLGTAVHLLATNPELQDSLRSDSSLVPTFIEEALRFDPPFRGHYRIATEDTELAGKTVPAGSHVVLMWPAANRDEGAYEQPDEVRLDRPNPRHHVGFGWGIHLCIGAPLARLEARVAVEELLRSTHGFRLNEDVDPPRYIQSLLVRRFDSLPLVLG
jgi:cytochrome P450